MAQPYISGGQFTLGPANSVAIFNGGQELDIGLLTEISWDSKARIQKKEVDLMRGLSFQIPFLKGWEGTISIQRTNSKLDQWWSNVELNYKAQLGYPAYTIIQRIRETDGTITTLTFPGAFLFYDEAGKYSNEETVMQTVTFTGPDRIVTVA